MKNVYSAVRTGSLNNAVFKGLTTEQSEITLSN